MTEIKNNITKLMFAASVFGLLLSMFHYHSVVLDCLEHQGQPHYAEYVLVCPICALNVNVDTDQSLQFKTFIEFNDYVIILNDRITTQEAYKTTLGRSPPLFS